MSFDTSEYLKLRKKRLEEEEKKNKKTTNTSKGFDADEYLKLREQRLANEKKSSTKKTTSNDDIAPVKETEEKKSWFKSGLFEDGWDFGDLTRTILGTTADVSTGVVQGAANLVEGITDLGLYGVSGLSSLVGADEFAKDVKGLAKENSVNTAFDSFRGSLGIDEASVLGEKSYGVAQGLGQVGAIILTGGAAGAAGASAAAASAITTGAMGLSSWGSGMSEAYQSGASDEDAVSYGVIKGVVDAGSELIFGGLGKSVKALGLSRGLTSVDDVFAKKLSSKISNRALSNLTEYGVKASAEGVEEVLAGIGSAVGKKLTYMSDEELTKLVEDEDLLDQFIMGAVTSGVAQSGIVPTMKSGSLIDTTKRDVDFVSGMSKYDEQVANKVSEDIIAEREAKGEKLSQKEKNAIYDDVLEKMERGEIETEAIEEVLGGDTYKSYKDTVDNEEALKKELAELRQMKNGDRTDIQNDRLAELKAMNLEDTTKRDGLKSQLSNEVFSLVKDGKLVESYKERAKRSQAFTANLDEYDEKYRSAIQKAMDSGVWNNSRKSHEALNFLARISVDKGVDFDYLTNEKISKTSFGVEGKIVNGYRDGNTIGINIQSPKYLNTIVGHELTHILEGTDLYNEFSKTITTYAKNTGDYQGRYDSLSKLYKGVKGYETDFDTKVEKEIVADLVGDYIFTDSKFLARLNTENKNIFQKLYDEIKYLCRVATAGSKEAKELERVKREFEKVYRGEAKTDTEVGKEYSLCEFEDGKRFVSVEADSGLFDGLSIKEQTDLATKILKERFQGKVIGIDNKVFVNGKTVDEFAHPAKHIDNGIYEAKLRASSELDNLVDAGFGFRNESDGRDGHTHSDVTGGFDYFDVIFRVGNEYYQGVINIKNISRGKLLKDITKIKNITNDVTSQYGETPTYAFIRDVSMDIISQNSEKSSGKNQFSLSEEQQEYFKDSKVRDENGNLKVMYHGTSNGGHTVFDTFGESKFGLFGAGTYFTDNKEIAESYTEKGRGNNKQVYESYLNITNPIDMDAKANVEAWKKAFPDADYTDCTTNEDCFRAMKEVFVDEQYPQWEAKDTAMDVLESMGYDGITHIGGGRVNSDGENHRVYIAFNPEQIKNIDNASPTSNPDIRYSLSDSEGNQLTKEQSKYFKNSKAVDNNGNLLKVYHTTKNDFTVFDKARKGEATEDTNTYLGFFFSDDAEYMQNFPEFQDGKTEAYYLNMTNPIDMTNISKEAFLDIVEVMGGDVSEAVDVYDDADSHQLGHLLDDLTGDFYYNDFVKELKPHYDELVSRGYDGVINYMDEMFGVKEYVVLDSNQAKLTSNTNPTTDSDVRYSLAENKIVPATDTMYSLSAVPSHKVKLEKAYSVDSSTDLKTIVSRYDKIIDIWKRLGGEIDSKFLNDWNNKSKPDKEFTVFKAQSGYKYNVELSTMCKKGVPLFEAIDTIVKKEVMNELGIDKIGKAEKEILYDILKQHNFEIPCAICYVEQARQREGVIIDAFLNGKQDTNAKGEVTKVKLGWNSILSQAEQEMKARGVDYTFPEVSRDIATDAYSPTTTGMDENTQNEFFDILKNLANKEIARYNKAEKKNRKLLKDVTPEAVKECFKGTLPSNLKIFKVLFTDSSSRFKIQNDLLYSSLTTQNLARSHNALYGLFNSQGGVSGYKTKQGTTAYWGDILGKTWRPETLRKEGGVRNQSNSDFQMFTLLDQAQMYIDFTAKGYYLQAYTKVLSELKLFGLSKGKINASLIPKVTVYRDANGDVDVARTMENAGLDENGNPIFDDVEGINHKEAFMLLEDPEYSKSIGGICIGYSDNHIRALLDDNRVQQIIGFHDKTDDPSKRYVGAKYAKNYNGLNEAIKDNGEGETVHIGFNQFVKKAESKFKYNEQTESYEGTINHNGKTYVADDIPKLAADLYLEMCENKNYKPAYDDFKTHENYYKLLADFGLYDSQGHYAPHRKVEYNMPDTVPYLDADGNKQYMDTEKYIKIELEKELAVRDSIAEALSDTSKEGIIPQFKERVKELNKLLPSQLSLSEIGEAPTKYGDYNISSEEVMYKPNIAPVREDVSQTKNVEEVAPVVTDVAQNEIAPTTEDVAPVPETKADNIEEEQVAETLTEADIAPTKQGIKGKVNGLKSAMNKFITLVGDKGFSVENLAKATKNRKLEALYDKLHRSEAKAQIFIGDGADGVKSIDTLRKEVLDSGLEKEFYDYVNHRHNIDRMSLEAKELPNLRRLEAEMRKLKLEKLNDNQLKAIASERITDETTPKRSHLIKTVREYLVSKEIKNKPVFAWSMTAEKSQKIVAELEAKHPELKQYAQDVYNITNQLRKMLVDNGVISQETADLWEEMYPHYVPIHRQGDEGLNVNVPLDSGRTGINAPIKRATGGNRNIDPLFKTLAERASQTFRAIDRNAFGIELKNTLKSEIETNKASLDDAFNTLDANEGLLQEGKNGMNPTFTVFENGKRVTFEITKDLYDALKPTNETLAKTSKVLNKASDIQRGLLTEYNPVFTATNAIKDFQDILMNSQHAGKTYATIPKAINELRKKGKWYQEYIKNGGEQNTYFDKQKNAFEKEKSLARKIVGFPFDKISDINNFFEKIPRLAEYIASRESGADVDIAMLDAARVTTNFAAGGDLTKFANRNGFTFLNASVQGAMQQVRNVREAKMNGLKGYMQLAAKATVAGLPVMLLNGLFWEDDEDYEELSDYVKDNYYIVGKYGDGEFVRIPKGRTVAVIQNVFEQAGNWVTGDDEVDIGRFGELVVNNLAPNNPLENNVFAPIKQAYIDNKTWYGDDLVPTRLQDLPAAEQYDETTDSLSRWLGENLNMSPYKINYVLNQYSGAVGDVVLPMLTPKAERGDNSLLGNIIAPYKDKFTTDSVLKNQSVSDFYELSDELTANANSSYATDEDILMSKYINSVSGEMGELYKQKREIQNSSLSDDVKYKMVRDIQEQINELAKKGITTHGNVTISGSYGKVGNKYYHVNNSGEWVKITDEQLEKQKSVLNKLGISASEYWDNKEEYDYAYDFPQNYAVSKVIGGYDTYKKHASEINDIKADKNADGKSISGSRKKKVVEYLNNSDLDYYSRLIIYKTLYNADDRYNKQILNYLNSRTDLSYEERVDILKSFGCTVTADGKVKW